MLIKIIKDVPVKPLHKIYKNSIYKVFEERKRFYLIESQETGKGVWVRKDEAVIYKGRSTMKYSEMAICLKFLERMKYKLILGHYNREGSQFGIVNPMNPPIEHYFINEFPFNSAFCFIFRKSKVRHNEDYDICFCPMKPYENPQWPVYRTEYLGPDGETIEKARRSCVHFKGAKTGKIKLRSTQKQLEMIESIRVVEIVKHLKKVKLTPYQKKVMSTKWFLFIKHRVEEWETINKRRFL
jgi:hypothetical protein